MKKIVQGTCRVFYGLCFWCLVLCSINFQDISFFLSLPFNFYTIFQAWFLVVMPLRELANFSQSSFLLIWLDFWIVVWHFSTGWGVAHDWFSWIFYRIIFFYLLVFVVGYSTRAWGKVFCITGNADFAEIWIFVYKNLWSELQQIVISLDL